MNIDLKPIKGFMKKYKELIAVLFVFATFFSLYRVVPMMYDGWAGKFYYPTHGGILNWFNYICGPFYEWINGRISSNIICGIFESFSSEVPLDLFNAITITASFILAYSVLKKEEKNKNEFVNGILLFMSIILLVTPRMRTEVLFYANMAYIVPIPLMLIYYKIYTKNANKSVDYKKITIMSLIGFVIGTWMEHIAVGFLLTICAVNAIEFIRKNINKWKLLIPTIFTGIGVLIMFMSPGLYKAREVVSESTGITETFISNIKYIYVDLISKNIYLFLLLFVFITIFFIKAEFKNKICKSITLGLSAFLTFTLLLGSLFFTFNISNLQSILELYPSSAGMAHNFSYIILIIGLMVSLLIVAIVKSKNKIILSYLLSICLLSLAPMCITPNVGARITSVGFFIIALITIIIYTEISKDNRIIEKAMIIIVYFMTVVALDNTILMMRRINDVTKLRNTIIEEVVIQQKLNNWDYDKYVILPLYADNDVLNRGTVEENTFYYPQFLEAYGLNPNTKVLFSNSEVSATQFHDEEKIGINVVTETPEDMKFMYIVQYSEDSLVEYKDIINTGFIEDKSYTFEPASKGYYQIKSYFQKGNNVKEIEGYFLFHVE